MATMAIKTVATGISHIQPEARNATRAPKSNVMPAKIHTGPATTCDPSHASLDLRTSGTRNPTYVFPGRRRAVAKPPQTSQYTEQINTIIPTATMRVILLPNQDSYPISKDWTPLAVG